MPPIRRVTASDLKIKLLLYGRPGVGKTYLAAEANDHPALAPALFLNFEGGLLSVVGRGDIDAIDITSVADLEAAYLDIRDGKNGTDRYRTIVIDSASELYNKSLEEAIAARAKGRSVDKIEIGDYGKASYQVHRLFRAFRDLDRNIIATAHAKMVYSQLQDSRSEQPIEVTPQFPEKLSQQLMGIFDWAWFQYLFEREAEDGGTETVRAILTRDRGAYKAKTRGRTFPLALGEIVENATLPQIYDLYLRCEGQAVPIASGDVPAVEEELEAEY
jgi:phage nucleotide-binding protein